MAARDVVHIHGDTPKRTEQLRDVLSCTPFGEDSRVRLADSDTDSPSRFDAATYFSSLKAREAEVVAPQARAVHSVETHQGVALGRGRRVSLAQVVGDPFI
jgi:hypothetical protein